MLHNASVQIQPSCTRDVTSSVAEQSSVLKWALMCKTLRETEILAALSDKIWEGNREGGRERGREREIETRTYS